MNDHNEALAMLCSPEVEADVTNKSIEAMLESLNENRSKLEACGEVLEEEGFLAGHKEILAEAYAYARENATNPVEFNKLLTREMSSKTSRLFIKQLRQAPIRYLCQTELTDIATAASEYSGELLAGIISNSTTCHAELAAEVVAEEATRMLRKVLIPLNDTGLQFTNRVVSDLTRQVVNGVLQKHGFETIFS